MGVLVALVATCLAYKVAALENGLMRTPAMGFNTWNAFRGKINETVLLDTVDRMVSLGLVQAGYTYLTLDDGWPENERSKDGYLVANKTKFPSGIKSLAAKVHSKGMKLGIYSDAGKATCLSYPASLGYEERDAATFASWDVDFLKYDNCYSVDPAKMTVRQRYEAMRDALNKTGRPIAFSMCEWGVSSPWEYGHEVGNSWRTSADISLAIEADWEGIMDNLDSVAGLSRYAGPGGWNDVDMLEVGLPGSAKLSLVEQQAHFAMWAMVKSPLIIGADLSLLGREQLEILMAKEVIALHQDPLGVPADVVWQQGPKQVWATPLKGGDRGVALFNRHMNLDGFFQQSNLTVTWSMLGLPAHSRCEVRDVFARRNLGTFTSGFTALVRNHGVLVLRMKPLNVDAAMAEVWRPWQAGVDTNEPGVTVVREPIGCPDCSVVAGTIYTGKLYLIGMLVGVLVGAALAWAQLRRVCVSRSSHAVDFQAVSDCETCCVLSMERMQD